MRSPQQRRSLSESPSVAARDPWRYTFTCSALPLILPLIFSLALLILEYSPLLMR